MKVFNMKKFVLAASLALAGSMAFADTTTLNGTVHDLTPNNPDFEGGISGVVTGLVKNTLGSSNVPELSSSWTPGLGAITSQSSFAQWFDTSSNSAPLSLTLTSSSNGIYTYNNNNFFPIDGQILGNQGRSHNYHFTYQIHASFGWDPTKANQNFTFTGDDDVWVYFDKRLGIDLGGVHGAASQTVNLNSFMAGKAAGNYAFDFFFAERHTSQSNLGISTTLNLVTTPVPEPETYAMMLAGLAGLGLVARRKQAKQLG